MTLFGTVLLMFVLIAAVGLTGVPVASSMRTDIALPGATLGAFFGNFFEHFGPMVGGLPVVPVTIGAFVFSIGLRILVYEAQRGVFHHSTPLEY